MTSYLPYPTLISYQIEISNPRLSTFSIHVPKLNVYDCTGIWAEHDVSHRILAVAQVLVSIMPCGQIVTSDKTSSCSSRNTSKKLFIAASQTRVYNELFVLDVDVMLTRVNAASQTRVYNELFVLDVDVMLTRVNAASQTRVYNELSVLDVDVMLTRVNVSVIFELEMVRDKVFSLKGFDVEEVTDIITQCCTS